MTTQELINQMPHTSIWAAAEAIRQGVIMYQAAEKERRVQDARPESKRDYKLWSGMVNEAIPAFAEILYCIFQGSAMAFQQCIEKAGREVDPAMCYDRELLFMKFCEDYAEMNGGNAPRIRKFQ